jgi:hypothetical protein
MPEDMRDGEGAEPDHRQASCRAPPVALQPDSQTSQSTPSKHDAAERT